MLFYAQNVFGKKINWLAIVRITSNTILLGAHIRFKILAFFPNLPSVSENSERESNAILWPLYLYLSRLAFLVGFTNPNKQLPNVKSVYKFHHLGFSV